MNSIEILLAVRSLLAEPERWFKKGLARAADDRKVSLTHPHACKFTLDGAFARIQYITRFNVGPAYSLLKSLVHPALVAHFNDAQGTTHWTVLQMLDRAILLAGGTPPVVQDEAEKQY